MYNNGLSTEQSHELVEKHIQLANKLAHLKKKQLPKHISFEELQSAAFMGLVQAANRFNPKLNIRFSTYAYPRIAGEINDYLRSLGYFSTSIEDIDGEFSIKDTLVSKRSDTNEIFEFVAESIGEQAADMLRSYYLDRLSMKEIGDKYGISEGRVSQLFSSYREDIRDKWQSFDLAA